MAELTKKLHLKKGTTEQTAKAYSTTAEVGSEYITNKIDNVNCYIPIGSTTDSRATIGRVKKSGGQEKAILSSGKPAYTEKSWTSAGTYTWTCPTGITRVRVAVCGGGAGSYYRHSWVSYPGESGGTSSAFGLSATGGTSGRDGGAGGSPNGVGGSGYIGSDYTPGFALSFTKTSGTYGRGAGSSSSTSYKTGGSGGYNSSYANVSAGKTYSIVVGKGGTSGNSGQSGTSGFVFIAWGGSI